MTLPDVDLSTYRNRHSTANKVGRLLWIIVWHVFFRFTPRPLCVWRAALLRLFGARLGRHCVVHPSCRIWAPWNLEMGDYACLAYDVDMYNVAPVQIGAHTTVSQYCHICTASHDIRSPNMELITAPIHVGAHAWLAAHAFIAPGVTIGDGAVVGACAVVTRNVAPWTVVAGNPAGFIKKREINTPQK